MLKKLLTFALLLGVAPQAVAQFAENRRWALYATYGLLIAVNLGLLGIVGLALLNQFTATIAPQLMEPAALEANWWGVAAALHMAAIAGIRSCRGLFLPSKFFAASMVMSFAGAPAGLPVAAGTQVPNTRYAGFS